MVDTSSGKSTVLQLRELHRWFYDDEAVGMDLSKWSVLTAAVPSIGISDLGRLLRTFFPQAQCFPKLIANTLEHSFREEEGAP